MTEIKTGDTICFPSGKVDRVIYVSDGLVYTAKFGAFPIGDVQPTDQPNIWSYVGHSQP